MPRHNYARPEGRIVEISVEAPTVRGNLLGDPATRTVAVYLPPGYETSTDEYPLLVDLAAFTSSGLKRLAWTGFGESVPQRIDRLVKADQMGPAIVAFPDCFTRLGGNQYVDSSVMGGWGSFIAHDLAPALAAHFRIRSGPEHRAVYGKSSGGYGALVQALQFPNTWAAAACHSGDLGFEWVYLREFPGALDTLSRFDGDIERFVAAFDAAPKVRGGDLHTLMLLAMAASYDPDPTAPFGARLPVDMHTCELDPERWAAWLAHDPVRMLDDASARANLAQLATVFVDCGRRDQYALHYGARTFSKHLQSHGIEHIYEEFDDNHSSIDYRLDRSLPLLYQAIA